MISINKFQNDLLDIDKSIFLDDLNNSYFHYTKTENIDKIFNNNQLFVSNKKYMNDQNEVEYPQNILLNELKTYQSTEATRFLDILNDNWMNDDLYSFSITSNDSNSYLIDNYGNSIIKIDINGLKLASVKNYGKPSWRFGKVIYKMKDQKNITKRFLKLYFNIERRQVSNCSDTEYINMENIQNELINLLCVALDLFKEECKYSEEEETRIVFSFQENTDEAIFRSLINNKEKLYIILENITSFAKFYKTIT